MLLSYPELLELPRRCSKTKGVLNIFAKFTRKHLSESLFFNKIVGIRPATLLKRDCSTGTFPMNFPKLLRTPILKNICERLLLAAGLRTT